MEANQPKGTKMTKYIVKAYGMICEFATREAAEVFFESNACGCEKVDGQYVRKVTE